MKIVVSDYVLEILTVVIVAKKWTLTAYKWYTPISNKVASEKNDA